MVRKLIVYHSDGHVTQVFDEETGLEITAECELIDSSGLRLSLAGDPYSWIVFKRSSEGRFYMDKWTGELAYEFGVVVRVEETPRKDIKK
jgi:hypothetical protein